ncbi:MAG: ATP-dependent DNA helicase RecG [Methylococcaceae bacterium]|nr:ATP-dependent DNA helicase RecG [Methylococcaceae bacterium]
MDTRNPLSNPVSDLSGIGGKTAKLLEKLGIFRIQDLLFHLPIRYEDRTRVLAISQIKAGMTALITGKIVFIDVLPRGRKSLICRVEDDSGSIDLRFFHFTARQHAGFKPGTTLSCFGEIRYGYAGLEMIHPDYSVIYQENTVVTEPYLTPVYPLTERLNQGTIRKAVKQALALCETTTALLNDWIPDSVLKENRYPSLAEAIKALHTPYANADTNALLNGTDPSIKRLAFEELLSHQLSRKLAKQKARLWEAPKVSSTDSLSKQFIQTLPFNLTEAQQKVISEIRSDLESAYPMMRLVQGDVGSGKTVVAAVAAFFALNSGYQVAVMAPTELLAEQHYRNFSDWFKECTKQIVLLTGQLKGNARKEITGQIADGTAGIIIGTHALFQDAVNFHRLGLIIIDEQHRFGVHQRLALRTKGQKENVSPHQLVMTATPIPRTLAMLQYSDLDISIIDQLPPGRKPVTTSVIPSERRDEVIARINGWVSQQKQAYWVCTLIEESEILQCEAAEKTAERLAVALPDIRLALLHGRIKPAEKEAIMRAFKNREIDLLVATTVIEVGVDVPNASLMIIENPERLGLSQLHQLRGRVGRGVDESYCLLMYQSPLSENARQRLGILRESNDGFYIAEKDLLLRGPGEVMGTRQTGQVNFKIADLVRDADLLDNIAMLADSVLSQQPEIAPPLIERWLGYRSDYSEV